MDCLAMVQTAPRTLEAQRFPLPDLGPDEGLLRVEACGICGSDCEQFDGILPVPLPVIPGHEPLGRIDRIGARAAERWGVAEGDRVVVEAILSCGHCRLCKEGLRHLCMGGGNGFRAYAYTPVERPPALWGAYAEYMYLAPETVLHRISDDLPPEIAVMYNPLGAGYRWAREIGEVTEGETVVVLGPGQRGLACVIVAAEAGAENIVVSGLAKDARKLELARAYGATHTVDVEHEDLTGLVFDLTRGDGADLVIDVSAYALEPVADTLTLSRRGGRVVLAGVKGMKPIPDFVSDRAVLKELTIRGAFGVTSSAFDSAIARIESGTIDLAAMHTHTFPLLDAERAIQTLAGRVAGEDAIHCCLVTA
jgi:threonine dehydrogenase-like Zn-dependent dehydrogenase